MIQTIYSRPRLVFGCGNPLFGDDGFGAEVIRRLEANFTLPADVACFDAGTAVRDILFDFLLSENRPDQIIIIDAMTLPGAPAGEIREIGLDAIQPSKIVDFSLHQFPTTNMLQEIHRHTGIDVRILVVHPQKIPPAVCPGLSAPVRRAVPEMCRRVMALLDVENNPHATEGTAIEIRVGTFARQMGVHRNTVTNWIKKGRIRMRPAAGRKYSVEPAELRRFCREAGMAEPRLGEMVKHATRGEAGDGAAHGYIHS